MADVITSRFLFGALQCANVQTSEGVWPQLHLRRKDVGLYRRNAARRDRMGQTLVSRNEKYTRRNGSPVELHLNTQMSDRDESLRSHSVLRCRTSTK